MHHIITISTEIIEVIKLDFDMGLPNAEATIRPI